MKTLTQEQASAYAGSVSSGSLLPRDVIPQLVTLYERLCDEVGDLKPAIEVRKEWEDEIWPLTKPDDADPDPVIEFWNDLDDKINELLPEGFIFGAHEGDGADFGIWYDMSDDVPDNPKVDRGEDFHSDG